MSITDKNTRIDTSTNNTFDIDVVNATLKDIVSNSYHNLINIQKGDIGLDRFNYTTTDISSDKNGIYINASRELIESSSRRLYKGSKYYNKILSINDMILNKNIFIKIPLLFIDGLLTFEFKVKSDNDKTTLILPYNKDLIKNNHSFTVLYIYNTDIISLKLNKYAMSSYNNAVPLNLFSNTIKLDGSYKLFSYVQDTKNIQTSPANKTTIVDGKLVIEPTPYSQTIINTAYEFNLICFGIRYFNEIDKVYNVKERMSTNEKSIELCIIDKYDMPIPAENILVYKYNSIVNDYILNNDCHVIRHYPFIYEIKDSNMIDSDKYKIKYFYADILDDYSFTNLLYPYLRLLKVKLNKDKLEDVINDAFFSDTSSDYYLQLFDKYFNFDDHSYEFNMHKYAPYVPDHFGYKINTMFDFIKHNTDNMRDYVIKQNDCGTTFYTFVSNIDLNSRIRTNTLPDTGIDFILPEESYVFKFNREKNGFIKLRFFIDGLNIIPLYYGSHKDFDYIYLPKSAIKADSFIEIEKFEEYTFSTDIQLNSLGVPTEIILDDYSDVNFKPSLKDLYILDKETSTIVSEDKFQIYLEIDGTITPIDSTRYTTLSKFYIKLLDDSLNNNTFTVTIGKTQELIHTKFTAGSLCEAILAGNFKRIKNYVRVFYNGRLLPYEFWKLVNINETNKPYLITKFNITEDVTMTFDITPYHYELIYSVKEIDNSRMIDLESVLDKPFDLLYYDIYLNGRKLSIPNVVYLSPTKIKLINVDSNYNLQIYRKDRNDEYFSIKNIEGKVIQPIDELLNDTSLSDNDKKIIIDNEVKYKKPSNVDPTNTTDETDKFNFDISGNNDFDLLLFVKDQLFELTKINPDILQLNSYIIKNYDTIYNSMISDGRTTYKNVVKINPDVNFNANKVIKISSDIK